MRLTLHTDYSLRVLMYTAIRGQELSTITEIADHFDISKNHLMKVVSELGRKGYLENVRGKKGGIRLMRKPNQINIGTVVRDIEEELSIVGCLRGVDFCPIEEVCVLRHALRDATMAFLAVLDRYTLDDLIKPGRALAGLLAISVPRLPSKARAPA